MHLTFGIVAGACALLFFALTTVRLLLRTKGWTLKHPWVEELLRDLALAVGPLAFAILMWELALHEPRRQALVESMTAALREQYSEIASVQDSGIRAVRSGFSTAGTRDFMKGAQHTVIFSTSWILDPSAYKQVFSERLAAGVTVEVLMLKPGSPFAAQRGQAIQPSNPISGQAEPAKTLLALSELHKQPGGSNLTVRLYDAMPAVFTVVVDDAALVGFYPHFGIAYQAPIFECTLRQATAETTLGQLVAKELDALRNLSDNVDLASVTPKAGGGVDFRTFPRAAGTR